MVTIVIKIDDSQIKEIKNFTHDMLKEVDEALNQSAIIVASKVREKIHKGSRSGRIYKRGRRGNYIYHQASAPGEPPKSDTGNLAKHTYSEHIGFLKAAVISDAAYSAALEYGAPKRNLEPRPYLEPTKKETRREVDSIIDAAIKRAINK